MIQACLRSLPLLSVTAGGEAEQSTLTRYRAHTIQPISISVRSLLVRHQAEHTHGWHCDTACVDCELNQSPQRRRHRERVLQGLRPDLEEGCWLEAALGSPRSGAWTHCTMQCRQSCAALGSTPAHSNSPAAAVSQPLTAAAQYHGRRACQVAAHAQVAHATSGAADGIARSVAQNFVTFWA